VVTDRQFDHSPAILQRPDLHFDVPAKPPVSELKLHQGVVSDEAQRSHVAETAAPVCGDDRAAEPVAESLYRFEMTAGIRERHSVAQDDFHSRIDGASPDIRFFTGEPVAAVGGTEKHPLTVFGPLLQTPPGRRPIPAQRFRDNLSARGRRDAHGRIGAPVVHHAHPPYAKGQPLPHHPGYAFFLVQRRNYNSCTFQKTFSACRREVDAHSIRMEAMGLVFAGNFCRCGLFLQLVQGPVVISESNFYFFAAFEGGALGFR